MTKNTECNTPTFYRVSIAAMYTQEEMELYGGIEDNKTFAQILAGYVPDGESRETLYFVDLKHVVINSKVDSHEIVAAEGWCKAVGLERLGMLEDAQITPPEFIRNSHRSPEFMKQFLSPLPGFLDFLLGHLGVTVVYGDEAKKASGWFLNNGVQTWLLHVSEVSSVHDPGRLPSATS